MNPIVHKLTLGFAFLAISGGAGLSIYEMAKAPTTAAAKTATIPDDGEYTEFSVDGQKWALVKLFSSDRSQGLEVYSPNVDPGVDLKVIKNRIIKEGNIKGFILEQRSPKGDSVYGYALIADTPSSDPEKYRIVKITKAWVAKNPNVLDNLVKQ